MRLSNDDFIGALERSRGWFLRHVQGMTEEQARFKPYLQCKSVLETLVHLAAGDASALESLQTGEAVPYAKHEPALTDLGSLLETLAQRRNDLMTYLMSEVASMPMDKPITIWGETMPAAVGLAFLSSEDYYHSGQVAYIRLATDPGWDYDRDVFGE
jgi:uncharacterized damage-inducible protein DinB